MIRSFMDAYCSYRSVSELTPVDVENKGPTVTKKKKYENLATDVRFLQLSPAAGYIKIYARPREYLSANHSHWEGGGGGWGSNK